MPYRVSRSLSSRLPRLGALPPRGTTFLGGIKEPRQSLLIPPLLSTLQPRASHCFIANAVFELAVRMLLCDDPRLEPGECCLGD